MMKESEFEKQLVRELTVKYPGAYVIKNDPNYIQGFPDRLFLFNNFWAAFDTKRNRNSSLQPNQEFYIDRLNRMSLAMFVYPENKEDFLNEIQRALQFKRGSRIP